MIVTATVHLTIEELSVIGDALRERGLHELAMKFSAAEHPTCTWIKHAGQWAIACPVGINEGDIVFVRRADTGIRAARAGEELRKLKNGMIVRKRVALTEQTGSAP